MFQVQAPGGGLYLEGVYIKGLIFGMNCTVSAVPWLIEGSDYEARQTSKEQTKIYVGRSTTVHNLLFCVHTLCMNYVTNAFLLVSSSVRSTQLLYLVHGQGQKREQKHTTKNFVEFHNQLTIPLY